MNAAHCQRCSQLEQALASRDIVSTAKGLIMERFGISETEAFTLMTRLSQTTNVTVRLIAERLALEHEHRTCIH